MYQKKLIQSNGMWELAPLHSGGKITDVIRTGSSSKSDLHFDYDAMPARLRNKLISAGGGNRICKIVKPRNGSGLEDQDAWTYTYYVRDAQGNVIAVYERDFTTPSSSYYDILKLQENHLYGSSRTGVKSDTLTLSTVRYTYTSTTNNIYSGTFSTITTVAAATNNFRHEIGRRTYELVNHLGNVLVTVSDMRTANNSSGTVTGWNAVVNSAGDYYAFGAPLPGRTYSSANYRYGFNGQEKENELHGNTGDSYDFGARIYDARLGRWLSRDPFSIAFASNTPYGFSANSPIMLRDIDGKIQVDQDGNIILTSTGTYITDSRSVSKTNLDGSITTSTVYTKFEKVTIYANDGTPITAYRYVSSYTSTVTRSPDGKVSSPQVKQNAESQGFECHTDCHGLTFTDEKLWINDGDVDALLTHDGYTKNVKESEATAVIFRRADGSVAHSAIRNSDGTYTSNAGILETQTNQTLSEAKRNVKDITTTQFVKRTQQNQNMAFEDGKGGTVEGGFRIMTTEEHDKLIKVNPATTSGASFEWTPSSSGTTPASSTPSSTGSHSGAEPVNPK